MQLLKAMNINYSIGDRHLLDIEELKVYEGDRIGLVGKNGQGKSLLIRYLMGETDVTPSTELSASVGWFRQLEEVEDYDRMSGGERTLKKLDQLFQKGHELLILDEPTNNLDWKKIEQLEDRLRNHKGAYIVVSHDRVLLDEVCDTIWELDQGKLTIYNGNYTFYAEQKQLERQQQYDHHEKYVKEKRRLTNRMAAKRNQASGMRKAPSRMGNSEARLHKGKATEQQKKIERVSKVMENRLEKLEKVDKPFEWDAMKMEDFQVAQIHRKLVLFGKDLQVNVNRKHLFHCPSLQLKNGTKTAFIGDNGTGKSTLIRHILQGKEELDLTTQARIGHFTQSLEHLPEEKTVYEYVSETSTMPQHIIRIVLGRLRFKEEEVMKKIEVLSGGERVKAALARLLVGNFNVLILDEPTNHLDLEAMEALEALVRDYPGTVLFVTHDRRFIDQTANQLWVLEDGRLTYYDGDLSEYQSYKEQPSAADEMEYDKMTLETKLTELVSRLSMPVSDQEKASLEEEYDKVLKQLNKLRNK
ncbi:ribosomal protection-like ABC-F family protein [Thalassobacillus hwangdonensis]|uniref:Ribosomal protection-like ABC-F family protein n=1 Tax=Thalassobacillus hwangdonensis TaxID=546108 RepID=A0ABW3KY67_9BACI